ncbi:unnamed protein product [Didymodactylos carnosus]|uniref:Uncharacterized protein n=1 Tax=Didymodactylos carnosus TaxID=1234261 RepID=A0A813TNR9_9BILA|nr:unnamed protein product [Didymodactylos carnosus]CAF0815214.1 unnamed protein product [Didymodactylos carnosus]CAF3587750.1 unnamed protein product [Didymodactylos carnosus]CAF3601248.1 unnamed protein product [Didymodactylos carnosus]
MNQTQPIPTQYPPPGKVMVLEQHHRHHTRHHHHHQNAAENTQHQQQPTHSYPQIPTGPYGQQVQQHPTVQIAPQQQHLYQGVQPTSSFHSVSSIDSSAEMSKYFPDAQTPSLSPFRHHQAQVDGTESSHKTQASTVATSYGTSVTNGPYTNVQQPHQQQKLRPVHTQITPIRQSVGPILQSVRSQPQLRTPQSTSTYRTPGSQVTSRPSKPQGITGAPSIIEGIQISQALVNDVLVDLQSKVLNESMQNFYEDGSGGTHMEPLPPIYISAPQPTVILGSDLQRLRAELGNKNKRPVIYRQLRQDYLRDQQTMARAQLRANRPTSYPTNCYPTPKYTYLNRVFSTPRQLNKERSTYSQMQHPSWVLDDQLSYETYPTSNDARFDPQMGIYTVPDSETAKYAHLPPHLRQEYAYFTSPSTYRSPPPPRRSSTLRRKISRQTEPYCCTCGGVSGKTIVKNVFYKQQEQQESDSQYDCADLLRKLQSHVRIRYGYGTMNSDEPYALANYNELTRTLDFPVYVSSFQDKTLIPLPAY